jgi:protein ImuA
LDRLLPSGGLVRGTLVEWLAAGRGSGAGTLALLAARQACLKGGPLVVIDRPRRFYPAAAYRWGIEPAKIVLVQPASLRDEYWALDQVLRCAEVGAVLAWSERIDPRTFRRLQLAAESGEGLGLLVRPGRFRFEPSWADIRWQVSPKASTDGWHLRVEFLRLRGEVFRRQVELKIEEPAGQIHEADRVPLVSGLASAAAGGRPCGA